MPDSTPVQMANVRMEDLRNEQWDIALLLMQAAERVLTVQEVNAELAKLRAVITSAEITWR